MKDSKGFIIEHFYDRQLYYDDNLFHFLMSIYNLDTCEQNNSYISKKMQYFYLSWISYNEII